MKKLLIAAVVLQPFLGSCDKDNGNDEPMPDNDTTSVVDTVKHVEGDTAKNMEYLKFNKENKSPVSIKFDSIVQLFPDERIWFICNEPSGARIIDYVGVYRAIDTITNEEKCEVVYYASMYDNSLIKEWCRLGVLRDSAGFVLWNGKSYYNYNLKVGDTFQSRIIADSCGCMRVDSIIPQVMANNTEKRWFYLSSEFSRALWIEGIGSIIEPIGTDIGQVFEATGGVSYILRYYEIEKLVYSNPWGDNLCVGV